jgi:hypothetical protein
MNTLGKFVVIGAVLAASPVLAQGRGGGGGGGGANMGVGAGVNAGGQSGVNGRFGGQSEGRVNAQGSLNSNGPNAADRDFGADRAAERPLTGRAAEAQTRGSATAQGRSELGGLNAARASENARANASANSRVGEIATYESSMRTALTINDRARREAAIADARRQLAQTSNKPLTADVITQLDSELGIQGASPRLGVQ